MVYVINPEMMTTWRHIFKAVSRRTARGFLALCLLPTLVLRPASVEAFLIHEHGEHNSHTHALSRADLDHWPEQHGHQHGDQEPVSNRVGDDANGILLVLYDSIAILSSGRFTSALGAPSAPVSPLATAVLSDAHDPLLHPPPVRYLNSSKLSPPGTMLSILLSNHALLL